VSEVAAERPATDPLVLGRYALFDELAAGGMATVHLARLLVSDGEGRTVAIKRLHAQYTKDPEFCAMFLDEARLVTRIKHPHCVRTVDVVQDDHGLFLVMEYVHGESLSRLMRAARERQEPISPRLVATLLHGVLLGLHAAHEVAGPDGKLLGVVHRDVSPQNIIVGVDGTAKVLDFGIAKAAGRMQTTREGQIKGKLAYMAPEQIRGQVDRRADVFAAAVVLWEALANRRLHEGLKDVEIVTRIVQGRFVAPSTHAPGISPELDQIVLKGLAADPKKRYASAKDMAADLEARVGLLDRSEIAAWVDRLAKTVLEKRAHKVARMEEAAKGLRPSETATRLRLPSSSDAFAPVSVTEQGAIVGAPKSDKDVSDELDAVAATVPPGQSRGGAATAPAVRIQTPIMPIVPGPIPVIGPPPGPHDITYTATSTQLTPSGTAIPVAARPGGPRPRLGNAASIALLTGSILLALSGVVLAGYALARRGAAAPSAPDTPRVAPPPMVSAPPSPSPSPSPVTPPASATVANDEPPPPASATPEAPAKPPVIKPAAKSCEPPYVLDAQGNKQFKTECMGL
jgi:serine/threonine-protein kinase